MGVKTGRLNGGRRVRVYWILMIDSSYCLFLVAVFVIVLTLVLRVCVRKFLLAKSVITKATYCSN